ncbi:hypothetical protein [Hydrogenophaga laconesensis]|uniref:DUF2946 domain-containing protein n=1 Tax=Hydrogenophaga laconesensis TaxID=1805971 RepID=A0ABU1V5C8_9BURK|nr:hypothetical protein [Hydrogenophaga laconesensis]MDR7092666.1 hypothetical protein [Hydrogenophaga laconesensis]
MRPWIAILLWALLLLPPGWASTPPTGAYNGGPTTLHHCPHAPCDQPAASADASHVDCSTCHGTCNLALFGTRAPGVTVQGAFPLPRPTPPPASQPADLPERPQWAALATA